MTVTLFVLQADLSNITLLLFDQFGRCEEGTFLEGQPHPHPNGSAS